MHGPFGYWALEDMRSGAKGRSSRLGTDHPPCILLNINRLLRGVAQSGQSAAFGTQRFPRFESLFPDHYYRVFLDSSAAEPRTVNALVGGSIPSQGANFGIESSSAVELIVAGSSPASLY